MPGCNTCDSTLTCIDCINLEFVLNSNNQCECKNKSKYIDINNVCQCNIFLITNKVCGSNCLKCKNLLKCDECIIPSMINNNDGTCSCPSFFFYNIETNSCQSNI